MSASGINASWPASCPSAITSGRPGPGTGGRPARGPWVQAASRTGSPVSASTTTSIRSRAAGGVTALPASRQCGCMVTSAVAASWAAVSASAVESARPRIDTQDTSILVVAWRIRFVCQMSGEDVRRDLLEPHPTVYGLGESMFIAYVVAASAGTPGRNGQMFASTANGVPPLDFSTGIGLPLPTCGRARGACTPASSRAGAGLPPAPPGSGECGVLG